MMWTSPKLTWSCAVLVVECPDLHKFHLLCWKSKFQCVVIGPWPLRTQFALSFKLMQVDRAILWARLTQPDVWSNHLQQTVVQRLALTLKGLTRVCLKDNRTSRAAVSMKALGSQSLLSKSEQALELRTLTAFWLPTWLSRAGKARSLLGSTAAVPGFDQSLVCNAGT